MTQITKLSFELHCNNYKKAVRKFSNKTKLTMIINSDSFISKALMMQDMIKI